ncbi:amino acid adenylation domain-containing protein [Clostridium felsineum]|uniref:amino acid adenylation domain-containing protein n=1 Tax=Clostridium felsineum TaxID=36839 RepID=UPI00214DCAAC|nr:amino acid adenylation domain-containing protein [Clostridium felsineum]MCR3759100.1 amino acid adenylation domain-containing protein [Clostridium felsineum]
MDQKFNILEKLNLSTNVKDIYTRYNKTKENIEINTLHEIVSKAAHKYPDNVAIIEGENKICYWELEEKSNQVANYLLKKHLKKSELVAVIASRKINTIINVLGILKAGCAYVPIDPDYPDDRVEYIKNNSNCNIILKEDTYDTENLSFYDKNKLSIKVDVNSLAYVIYTSGSTGVPKGVEITHKSACNTILDINRKFNVREEDRIIALSSMCFDLSVYDIFGCLSVGATLVQVADQRDVKNILEVVRNNKITIWNSIPSTMTILVDNIKAEDNSSDLRLVLLSGDWIPLNLPSKIKNHFKNSKVVSLGGATEASIWSIYYPIEEVKDTWKSIPYGMPLANQSIYILNYEQKLCPEGIKGEIYIGGDGVALGYINDEEKTKKAFINHPDFGKIYKTGDYGILNKGGYVEFIGREDNQVKVRGYRVELSEVETTMNSFEGIKSSIVTVKKDSLNNNYLCGYYVASKNMPKSEIKEHLSKMLPPYMIPTKLIQIERIPLTANGKIDRKNLPQPIDDNEANENYAAPSNEIQEKLVVIFQDAFEGKIKIGIKDNFYEMGLNSILMVSIISKLEEAFSIQIKFKDFLKLNNIEDLEKLIQKTSITHSSDGVDDKKTINKKREEIYYWSPIMQWRIENDVLIIGEKEYSEKVYLSLLPKLYFLTQNGCTLETIVNEFTYYNNLELRQALDKLMNDKILVNEILKIEDLFSSQDNLLKHDYGNDLIVKKEVYEKYKREQLNRKLSYDSEKVIELRQETKMPENMAKRYSCREYDCETKISFDDFSTMLSTFKQIKLGGYKYYYYASAGGLYPVDVFIYVKKDRIENVDNGLYYYNPVDNLLCLVEDKECITSDAHYFTNKDIFKESAFSIYFIYNAKVSMPRYKGSGYLYSLIDTGIMVSTLTQICENLNIGVCSIGDMNFEKIEAHFHLEKNQRFLHCLEGGIKINNSRITIS